MLRRARRKAERTGVPFELGVGDARSLAYSDESFDLVMNNNMLGLVPDGDIAPILREMRRVLRSDGRLVVVTMIRPTPRIAEWVYDLLAIRLGGWRDIDTRPHLEAAGFDVVRREVVVERGVPSEVLVAYKKRE
jgi:ubiquinone/menaquinone biosynthesis C-methylase UbiE